MSRRNRKGRFLGAVRWNEELAREAIEAGERSGLSWAEFSRQSGIGVHRLHWWRHRLGRRPEVSSPPAPAFLPVTLGGSTLTGSGGVEIQWPDGVRLRWAGPLSVGDLAQLAERLRRSC